MSYFLKKWSKLCLFLLKTSTNIYQWGKKNRLFLCTVYIIDIYTRKQDKNTKENHILQWSPTSKVPDLCKSTTSWAGGLSEEHISTQNFILDPGSCDRNTPGSCGGNGLLFFSTNIQTSLNQDTLRCKTT